MRTCTFASERAYKTQYIVSQDVCFADRLDAVPPSRNIVALIDRNAMRTQTDRICALLRTYDISSSYSVTAGERAKSLSRLRALLQYLQARKISKDGLLMVIGGGTVCDLGNIAAQLFRRGIDLVLVPTTLLGQVDASVGGKNGLNFNGVKNILGGFNHPLAVICDTGYLSTLGDEQIAGGLAECIKVFSVSSGEDFHRFFHRTTSSNWRSEDAFMADMVMTAIRRKLELLSDDPFEASSERYLNFGHAFAHSFEEKSSFRLSHGESVLLGMMLEIALSIQLGVSSERRLQPLISIIKNVSTPRCRKYWLPLADIQGEINTIKHNRRGRLHLVCLHEIGRPTFVDDIDDSTIQKAWWQAGVLLGYT
jgi:3-dehydroquinate synthase